MATAGTEYEGLGEGDGQKSNVAVELGNNTTTPDSPDFGKAPDGGSQAWLVAAGASCIFFSCLGFSNSFGVFQEYYTTHQLRGQSPDKIAWIGSLSAFLQFTASAIRGPLFDRFSAWACPSSPLTISQSTNVAVDSPASRGHLRLCHDDDKLMLRVLATNARARCSDGHSHGLYAVPSISSSIAVL